MGGKCVVFREDVGLSRDGMLRWGIGWQVKLTGRGWWGIMLLEGGEYVTTACMRVEWGGNY